MNAKLKLGIGIFLILLGGLFLGKSLEYYSNDYCEEQNLQYSGCVYGCGLSDLPTYRYDTCTNFCNQTYKISEQNDCTFVHKYLR
jgi:hypothetical protein